MGRANSVKRGLTIGLAIAVAGITYSYVSARSFRSEPASYVEAPSLRAEPAYAAVKPASDIIASVREMGLAPNSEVLRRGPYYVLHALNTRGTELRVIADAHFGDILSIRPALPSDLAPDYVRAPRIIQVPQPDNNNGARQDSPPLPRQRVTPPGGG